MPIDLVAGWMLKGTFSSMPFELGESGVEKEAGLAEVKDWKMGVLYGIRGKVPRFDFVSADLELVEILHTRYFGVRLGHGPGRSQFLDLLLLRVNSWRCLRIGRRCQINLAIRVRVRVGADTISIHVDIAIHIFGLAVPVTIHVIVCIFAVFARLRSTTEGGSLSQR